MDLDIASHQTRRYTVATPVYEGPLDLLLQLIERAELDITKLALAQVTDQYLEHIRQLENNAAEEVSAFLVIAAKLVQIKSEALLPRPPKREEGEEDPGEALARQLLAYKRFKSVAEGLGARESQGLRTYLRLAAPPKIEGTLDLSGVGLADLVKAAQRALVQVDSRTALKTVVAPSPVTIRQKIGSIVRHLRQLGRSSFLSLLSGTRSRLDIVVTFLAVLELIKQRKVNASQEAIFGEIEIEPAGDWEEIEEFELEFGE
jgi:segregation and condensation protein A